MPWGAAIGAAVGLYGANKQSKAADNAAKAQTGAADAASATQWNMFNQQRQDQEPFRQAGLTGLSEYMANLGLPTTAISSAAMDWTTGSSVPMMNAQLYESDPRYKYAWDRAVAEHSSLGPYTAASDRGVIEDRLQQLYNSQPAPAGTTTPGSTSSTQQDAFAKFRNTPGYQFGLDQGNKSAQASAAARGGLNSGATLKSLMKFGNDYADQQGYTPYMNRLASLSGIGQTATNQIGNYGQNAANQVSNNQINAGQARAQGIYDKSNAWSNFGQQAANVAGQVDWSKIGWGGV